jgi:hypothetical protein
MWRVGHSGVARAAAVEPALRNWSITAAAGVHMFTPIVA